MCGRQNGHNCMAWSQGGMETTALGGEGEVVGVRSNMGFALGACSGLSCPTRMSQKWEVEPTPRGIHPCQVVRR